MSSNITPNLEPTRDLSKFRFWCQKVLPLVYDDAISYYEVLCKVVDYLNTVIDNINIDADNIDELSDDFLELQTYVNNFFDDIDQLVTYTQRAETAATAASASAVTAASQAASSASSAQSAATSASNAASSTITSLEAQAAAVSAKNAAESAATAAGTSETNAGNSATAAAGSATAAAGSASDAASSATAAAGSATSAQGYADSADHYKDGANTAALKAEGLAAGKQNNVDVSSDSPYYHNNAKYYSEIASSVVEGADGAKAQAMIAGEEVSTTLTADYTVGSYIRVQGVLYKTTKDLQSGDTLTIGTNCEIAVIGDDLQKVHNDVDEKATIIIAESSGNPVFVQDGSKNGKIHKWNVIFKRAISSIVVGKFNNDINLCKNIKDYTAISPATGESSTNYGYAASDYIDITNYPSLYIFLNKQYSGGFNPSIAFYDANKDFISGYRYSSSLFTKTAITIPTGAIYLRLDCVRDIMLAKAVYVGVGDGCSRYSYALGVTVADNWTIELVSGIIKDTDNNEYIMTDTFDVKTDYGEQCLNTNASSQESQIIKYEADTKLFIEVNSDLKTNNIELMITPNIEKNMQASKSYNSGAFIICENKLYKATTNIASGADLTVGTNVVSTTIAAELAALT